MGLYTGSIKGINRAPYREQVLAILINRGLGDKLSPDEEKKINRVQRFLPAADCAWEIETARERDQETKQ